MTCWRSIRKLAWPALSRWLAHLFNCVWRSSFSLAEACFLSRDAVNRCAISRTLDVIGILPCFAASSAQIVQRPNVSRVPNRSLQSKHLGFMPALFPCIRIFQKIQGDCVGNVKTRNGTCSCFCCAASCPARASIWHDARDANDSVATKPWDMNVLK